MIRRVDRGKHVAAVLAGEVAGAYKLPADIARFREAADRVAGQPIPPRPESPEAARERVVDESAEAELAGKPWPDAVKVVAKAHRETQDYDLKAEVRAETHARLEVELNAVIAANTDVIITESLKPGLAAIVDELTEVAALIPEGADARMVLLVCSPEAQEAWRRAERLADCYLHVRRAYDALDVPAGDDLNAEFKEWSNPDQVWPRPRHRNLPGSQTPPWPTSSLVDRLLWLIRHQAALWTPTAAERQKAWEAKYAEVVREQKLARERAVAFGAALS